MTRTGRPISEEDLHAYVDGFLDPERRASVERYLGEHPDVAARVRIWQAGRDGLREGFAAEAQTPIPARLNLARMAERHAAWRWRPSRVAAGFALALMLGAAGGWMARGSDRPGGLAALALQAEAAHRVFAADSSHPVEFAAPELAQNVSYIARQLGRPVTPPDLSSAGYRLMGGRVISTAGGAGCMFLYEDGQGGRISVFVRAMHQRDLNVPMRPVAAEGSSGYAWSRDGLGVSLITNTPFQGLHDLSNAVRAELSGGA